MKRLLVLPAVALAAAPGVARAQYDVPPRQPPLICRGSVFVDIVGTSAGDRLQAYNRATRVWGEGSDDVLIGSTNRASCLLGGPGDDAIALYGGGGVAYGGPGRDTLYGSFRGDVINGGGDVDGVVAGGGDDKIDTRDGRSELVDCGPGDDIARGDRVDVLVGCELRNLTGPRARRLQARPRRTSITGTVRTSFVAPRSAPAGAYRALYVTGAAGRRCVGGPVELSRLPRVRRGRRVSIVLRRPPGGWCVGTANVVVVRSPGQTLPVAGVARLSFSVR